MSFPSPSFRGSFSRYCLLFVLLIGAASIALAQQQGVGAEPPVIPSPGQNRLPPNTRAIEGLVRDAKGAPVKNAVVLLKDTKTLQVRSYIAQDDGKYHFYGLNSDVNYQVRAENTDMTSPTKLISVFNSRQLIKVNLKLKKKKKPY